MSISLVIPTLDAQAEIGELLKILLSQTLCPDEIIVVDSASSDSTVEIASGFDGVRVIEIERCDFNHGLTRDMAFKESFGDIVCFMTQDAVPADERYIENLVEPILADSRVAISSGRQLPKKMLANLNDWLGNLTTAPRQIFGLKMTFQQWESRLILRRMSALHTEGAPISSLEVSVEPI